MSIATDMGVESLLTRLEPFALPSVLQFFKPLEDNQIVDRAGLQDAAFRVVPEDDQDVGFCVRAENTFDIESQGPAAEDTQVSLEHCRGLGGLLHVIHNATRDLNLGARMRFYEEHVANLSVVARFLKERHSKERLICKCFSRGLPAEAPFKFLIESFSSECFRARWGTVASCALAVREVLPALRFGWDAGKYLEGSGAARADSVAIPEVDRVVRCPFFEAYLCMIQTISELVLHLISWVEGCPCHWHLLTAGASRALPSATRRLLETCPMRGRRMLELAMNGFLEELTAFSQQSLLSLTQLFPADLSEADRASVVHDFELGRSFLTTVFCMKTAHFRSLPWSAAGLAYHDQERARQIWGQLRTRYGAGDSPEARALCQQLPRLFQHQVLQQGDQWYFGADLSSCPAFAAEVAALALMPIAERRVESQHARTHKGSKKSPCHTPASMSLQLRRKDLRSELCAGPKEFITKLAPCVFQCRSYRMCADIMRLGLHPAVLAQGSKSRCRVVRDALCRADVDSLHQCLPDICTRKIHVRARSAALPIVDDNASVEATMLGPLVHGLALEHMLSRLPEFAGSIDTGTQQPVVFAVAYDSQAFSLLREFLLPEAHEGQLPMLTYAPESSDALSVVEASSTIASAVDKLFQKLSQADSSEHRLKGVLFKLLPSTSRMKRFQAEGEVQFSNTDLPISLLRPVSFSREREELLVDTELLSMRSLVQGMSVDDIPCVLSMHSMSLEQLESVEGRARPCVLSESLPRFRATRLGHVCHAKLVAEGMFATTCRPISC